MFEFTSIAFTVFALFMILVCKNYFSAIVYIWLGIVVPFILYLLNWSDLILTEKSFWLYYIFFSCMFCTFVYGFLTLKRCPKYIFPNECIRFSKYGRFITYVMNLLFISIYLLENFMGSNSFFPALNGIDIHTYSAPLISYFTREPYIVMMCDYLAYKVTGKRKYLFLLLIILLLPLLSRAARMASMIGFIQILSLVVFVESAKRFGDRIQKKEFYQDLKKVFCLLFVISMTFIGYTNYRMNHYGLYNFKYSDFIKYTGPEYLSFLAPYYGYFPLSFNNLNNNMLFQNIDHNYYGLYSFHTLFFSVFRFHNIFGYSTTGSTDNNIIIDGAATVPTGFWEFYYDFGALCFIPIVIAFLISYFLLYKASREKQLIVYRVIYFWFIPSWFFMSFQNVLFRPSLIIGGAILFFVAKYSFKIKYDDGEVNI